MKISYTILDYQHETGKGRSFLDVGQFGNGLGNLFLHPH